MTDDPKPVEPVRAEGERPLFTIRVSRRGGLLAAAGAAGALGLDALVGGWPFIRTPAPAPPIGPTNVPPTVASADPPTPGPVPPGQARVVRFYDKEHTYHYVTDDGRGYNEFFVDPGYDAGGVHDVPDAAVESTSANNVFAGAERNRRLSKQQLAHRPRPSRVPEFTIPLGVQAQLQFTSANPNSQGYVEYALTYGVGNESRLTVRIGNQGVSILDGEQEVATLDKVDTSKPVNVFFEVDDGHVVAHVAQGKSRTGYVVNHGFPDPYIGIAMQAKSDGDQVGLKVLSEIDAELDRSLADGAREAAANKQALPFQLTKTGIAPPGPDLIG